MIRPILYLVWWGSSIVLLIYSIKEDGILRAILSWLNPLTPP